MATQPSSTHGDFYVYALLRGDTGQPFYVGKGKGKRWAFHEWEALSGARGHKCNTIRSMRSRGVAVIRAKLHEGLTEAVAHEYEVALIKAIGRRPTGPLVNLTDGGEGPSGLKHSPEAREKMAAAKRGRKLTPESIAKRSAAVRGIPRTPETVEKISAAQRGKRRRKMTPEEIGARSATVRGSKRSAETRAKMSAAQRGRKMSPESRAKMSVSHRGLKQTPEHIAKAAAAHTGTKRTPEARAKMSAAALRREAARRAAVTPAPVRVAARHRRSLAGCHSTPVIS